MVKGKYLDEVKDSIVKNIEEFERGKAELDDNEIDTVMPKVIEFYNKHPEGEDVYRDKNGCILLIQTPSAIIEKDDNGKPKKDKNGKTILQNGLVRYESNWGGEDSYLLRGCKFRIYGRTELISLFAPKNIWKQMGGVYDEKAFIKCSNIRTRYRKIGDGDDIKPMKEQDFVKRVNKLEFKDNEDKYYQDLSEIDDSDYLTYYSATITQVID